MVGEEEKSLHESEKNMPHIFSDFLASVVKLEELAAVGSKLLVGFHQELEFLRRPPINKISELVENTIKAIETKRVKSYVEAGCMKNHDGVENLSKLHTCQCGLQDHLSKAKCMLDELNCLIEEAAAISMQTSNEELPHFQNNELGNGLDQRSTSHENMDAISSSHVQKPEVTEYGVMMGVVYIMLKQDYKMQERIASSLNLNSSSGELNSYCMMWSLRPCINDEIMHQAWKLIK